MSVLASYSIKGGVGKTSTAVNLAYVAARAGRRTLLWDLDPQAAATYIFRVRPRVKGGTDRLLRKSTAAAAAIKATDFDGLDLLPADFTYRHMDLALDDAKRPTRQLQRILRPLQEEYELVVLDCPPSISLVSENVLRASDTVLVPLIPSTLSLRTLDQLERFLPSVDRAPRLLAFFSMVDRRKRLHRDALEQVPRERDNVLDTAIPSLAVIEQMAARRAPVQEYAPRSAAARAYQLLAGEVVT